MNGLLGVFGWEREMDGIETSFGAGINSSVIVRFGGLFLFFLSWKLGTLGGFMGGIWHGVNWAPGVIFL